MHVILNQEKVCVYAICKDEEQFVDRWFDSMQEADEIYVLDTGSTDQTVEKLKVRGVRVEKKIIIPWRFDVARNELLKLVPADCDVCVCTDLDEVLKYSGEAAETVVYLKGVQLNHYPDRTKTRAQYLPLLELSVAENPNDDRNTHYLGREYFFIIVMKMRLQCKKTFIFTKCDLGCRKSCSYAVYCTVV